MPKVGSKKFSYTKKGKAAARKEAKRTGKKVEKAKGYAHGGVVTARGSGAATRGDQFTVTKGG